MLQTYEGGCHCGRVRFRAEGDLDSVSWCNCSICTKKGFVHMVVTRERFHLLRGEDAISSYTFGTGVAKHTFCRHCGIHSFYTPRTAPDGFSVNVRCLDGVDVDSVKPRLFDGRHWEEAMRARQESGDASDVTGAA
jgi:hypothetical protein